MEVNLATSKIKKNLTYRLVEVTKNKIKHKFPTYPLVKMTTNRKQTYIFLALAGYWLMMNSSTGKISAAELFFLFFHLFETGIANTISSFK